MEAVTALTGARPAHRIDWGIVSTWLLGFGLVAYLGLKGGGFDPLVNDRVGIAVWWILLATVLVGALPRRRLGPLRWGALGLLAAFVLWTALSLGWTESTDKTAADLARVATYLGVFTLALFVHGPRGTRHMVAAVGTGVVFIACVALLSRLHPAWFSEAEQTARFLDNSRDRLSFPLDYWNGLAALIAIGLPPMLQVATCARTVATRSFAAAALPALVLTLFLTLSRGGIAAAILASALFVVLAPDRLPKLLTLLLGGAGGAVLVLAAAQRDALQQGLLNSTAEHQGNEVLAMTIVVCAGVGLVQAGIALGVANGVRPGWAHVSRRRALEVTAASAVVALFAVLALGLPAKASDAWSDFKSAEGHPGAGTERLGSIAGESRYQFWSSAVRQGQSEPLTGTGSGTFEFWWTRDGDTADIARDAHSLYAQTLGELGVVGLLLLAGFLLVVVAGGARGILSAGLRRRPQLIAALAGCLAFSLTAAVDWTWQLPVLPVAMLILAAALLGSESRHGKEPGALSFRIRTTIALASLIAIAAIALPLTSSSLLRDSQAKARGADLVGALEAARSAQNVQPSSAAPRLQMALLLEAQGDLAAAATAARDATDREATNWRNWLVRSRIEAKRGQAKAALHYYRRAKSLNPNSPLFAR